MKKNMKGFTLIELLAVIVILAIIMVVAVPQILNVISSSRENAWESNVKLVKDAIELNDSIVDIKPTEGTKVSTQTGCTAANIQSIAEIDTNSTTITASWNSSTSKCDVTISPASTGNFSDLDSSVAKTYHCATSGCTE